MEAYAAILLGFLVQDSAAARAQAAALLPGGGLACMCDAVGRCLAFYVTAGAAGAAGGAVARRPTCEPRL